MFEQAIEQDVLGRWRPPMFVAELFHRQGIWFLPFEKEPLRRPDRAVDGAFTTAPDQNLCGLEQFRCALIFPPGVSFLITTELLHRLRLPLVPNGRALALDDDERETIDERHHVWQDVLLRPEHLVLPGDDPLVVARRVEVNESDGMALSSIAPVLLKRDAVGERCIDSLVCLRKAGRRDLRHGFHSLRDVVVRQPEVQALERSAQPVGEDVDLRAAAFEFQFVRGEVGIAERLQQLDGRILREVQLVPPLHLRRHAASVSGVTRSSPVRRTDMSADFIMPNCSRHLLSSRNRVLV